jgi:uncharacterized protein (TIGR03083 family)
VLAAAAAAAPAAAADRRRSAGHRHQKRLGPALIDTDRLLAEILSSTDALADITGGADPATRVPTCPDWSLRQLTTHVGRAHRWAATIVATESAEPIPFREVPDGRLPGDPAERPGWLRRGASGLAEAVRGAGTGPVWTHLGMGPASYWARRMAHATAVHRADAQIAVGERPVIDPVIATDGIGEWLGLLSAGFDPERLAVLPQGAVLHLHVTGEGLDGEWLIRGGAGGIAVETGHGKGDAAVRGPASALLLVLMRRLPPDDPEVEVIGDRGLLERWLAATAF